MKQTIFVILIVSLCNAFINSEQLEQSVFGTSATLLISKTQILLPNDFTLGLKMIPLAISSIDKHHDYADRQGFVERKSTIGTGTGIVLYSRFDKTIYSASLSYVFELPYSYYYLASISAQYAFFSRVSIGLLLNYHFCNFKIAGNSPGYDEYYRFSKPYSLAVFANYAWNDYRDKFNIKHGLISGSGVIGFLLFGLLFAMNYGP